MLLGTPQGAVLELQDYKGIFFFRLGGGIGRMKWESVLYLTNILHRYIDSIPGTIGQLYHSLGLKIPQKLAGVLPTEFFSDDSMTLESKSPPPPSSAHRSVSGVTESEQLEELRTRSAKKRRYWSNYLYYS